MANLLNCPRFICVALLSISLCVVARAQEQSTITDTPSQDASGAGSANTAADPDPAWHMNLNFYLWLPGTHGILGANGYDVAYKASAGDLLSNFRFGLMAALGAQRGRFVMIGDMIWVRLEANKQIVLPIPNVPQLTGQAKAGQFILNPEFGYRVFDGEKLKIDAIGGCRYWHLESSLQFTPPVRNNNFSTSSNWADPLMGGRIQVPLSRRVLATVFRGRRWLGCRRTVGLSDCRHSWRPRKLKVVFGRWVSISLRKLSVWVLRISNSHERGLDRCELQL